jgi:hypothetical protein
MGSERTDMEQPKRGLSWAHIVGIGVLGVVASVTASYLVKRFLIGDPRPDIKVSLLVGTILPLVVILLSKRRKT